MQAKDLMTDLNKYSSDSDAIFLQRFFKTGPGEYGDGDVFIGVRVPDNRKVCKEYKNLALDEVQKLLESKIHEHRLAGVYILCYKCKKANEQEKQKIYDLYMQELANGQINNWDIVDMSCITIVGDYLIGKKRDILYHLAKSKKLWERRVSIISTAAFIRVDDFSTTLDIADILLHDEHDLIQKAVGWMLREVGKKIDENILTDYLEKTAATMPRTMLRYACEKLPKDKKQYFYNLKNI
jgi:3-methyladenine DNA glycosylase AlkD